MNEALCSSPKPWRRADLVALLVAALVVIGFRLHAFPAPLENDECNYAYFAERMLAGDRLYVDLWDHQPPGVFAALLVPSAVFGSSPIVSRILALMAVLVTLVGVFDLARRWFGSRAAWTGAFLFALCSADPGMAGEGCNREIYMNALLVGAWWVLGRGMVASGAVRLRVVFVAGLLVGLASVVKTVVAVHWLVLLPVLYMVAGRGMTPRLKVLAVFAVGPAVLWFGVWAYFAATERSDAFIDAVFVYNLTYSAVECGWWRRLAAFFQERAVFGTAVAMWVGGAAGLLALPWRRDSRRALAVGAYSLGSYLAVCMPGKFWGHYYLLMLPPLVLAAAALVDCVGRWRPRLAVVVGGVLLLGTLLTQVPGYLLVPSDRLAWDRYGDRMGWARDQAERIAMVTDPDDSIYTWSLDTGFYYYSGRRCATRFTMFGSLTADNPSTDVRRHQLIDDLEHDRPRLILIPFTPPPPCAELLAFIQEHRYVTVGRTERMEILGDSARPVERIDWAWHPE